MRVIGDSHIESGMMTIIQQRDLETELHDACADFYANPLGYVRFAFPWGEDNGPLRLPLIDPALLRLDMIALSLDCLVNAVIQRLGHSSRLP